MAKLTVVVDMLLVVVIIVVTVMTAEFKATRHLVQEM